VVRLFVIDMTQEQRNKIHELHEKIADTRLIEVWKRYKLQKEFEKLAHDCIIEFLTE